MGELWHLARQIVRAFDVQAFLWHVARDTCHLVIFDGFYLALRLAPRYASDAC